MSPLAPAALALALAHLVACGPAPAPAPVARAEPTAATPSPEVAAAPGKVRMPNEKTGLIPMTKGPRPAPEPPLTQEELDLIAADPATLSPELRRKRGYAVRRKILQDPDSPAARQLEALRLATQRGEIKPQLPGGDSGLVLRPQYPTPTPKPAPDPTPAPSPAPSPAP